MNPIQPNIHPTIWQRIANCAWSRAVTAAKIGAAAGAVIGSTLEAAINTDRSSEAELRLGAIATVAAVGTVATIAAEAFEGKAAAKKTAMFAAGATAATAIAVGSPRNGAIGTAVGGLFGAAIGAIIGAAIGTIEGAVGAFSSRKRNPPYSIRLSNPITRIITETSELPQKNEPGHTEEESISRPPPRTLSTAFTTSMSIQSIMPSIEPPIVQRLPTPSHQLTSSIFSSFSVVPVEKLHGIDESTGDDTTSPKHVTDEMTAPIPRPILSTSTFSFDPKPETKDEEIKEEDLKEQLLPEIPLVVPQPVIDFHQALPYLRALIGLSPNPGLFIRNLEGSCALANIQKIQYALPGPTYRPIHFAERKGGRQALLIQMPDGLMMLPPEEPKPKHPFAGLCSHLRKIPFSKDAASFLIPSMIKFPWVHSLMKGVQACSTAAKEDQERQALSLACVLYCALTQEKHDPKQLHKRTNALIGSFDKTESGHYELNKDKVPATEKKMEILRTVLMENLIEIRTLLELTNPKYVAKNTDLTALKKFTLEYLPQLKALIDELYHTH